MKEKISIVYTGLAVAFCVLASLVYKNGEVWRSVFLLALSVIYFILSFDKKEY